MNRNVFYVLAYSLLSALAPSTASAMDLKFSCTSIYPSKAEDTVVVANNAPEASRSNVLTLGTDRFTIRKAGWDASGLLLVAEEWPGQAEPRRILWLRFNTSRVSGYQAQETTASLRVESGRGRTIDSSPAGRATPLECALYLEPAR